MENAGFLSGLKKIVGTSVGALTAVGLASGLGVEGLSRVADKLDMNELKNKPQDFEARYPGVDVDWRIGFHAGRALELLDQLSAGSVGAYLGSNWSTRGFQKRLQALRQAVGEEAVARLDTLRHQDFESDRTRQMVTFTDLALLQRLDREIQNPGADRLGRYPQAHELLQR